MIKLDPISESICRRLRLFQGLRPLAEDTDLMHTFQKVFAQELLTFVESRFDIEQKTQLTRYLESGQQPDATALLSFANQIFHANPQTETQFEQRITALLDDFVSKATHA